MLGRTESARARSLRFYVDLVDRHGPDDDAVVLNVAVPQLEQVSQFLGPYGSVSREGIAQLELALNKHGPDAPVIAIEATGSLHRPWVTELERHHPGSVRLFAPSETKSARTQLVSGRFKTDDRGGGRRYGQQSSVDQLNALRPGLSAPSGHGRSLALDTPTGLAVLACAAAFSGRPPQLRSLMCRAPGRLRTETAQYWLQRWRGCLPPPADAEQRAHRLGRDLDRYHNLLLQQTRSLSVLVSRRLVGRVV
jgi:hypothetical protein